MAKLGHSAFVAIYTTELQKSVEAWKAVGFSVISTEQDITRLTDGQLLIAFSDREFPSPGVAYFDAASFGAACEEIVGPDGAVLFVRHGMPVDQAIRPTKEANALLGHVDSFVVGVPDALVARRWTEEQGFFVLEEFGGAHPQSEVTDGLVTLSLRQGFPGRMLTYTADVDEDLADAITEQLYTVGGEDLANTVTVLRDEDEVDTILMTMPEGTRISVVRDR